MISERKLKKWRREALINKQVPETSYANVMEMANRIDILTRHALDVYLLLPKASDFTVTKESMHAIQYGKEGEKDASS